MRRSILLNWQASNSFGWGLAGLTLLQRWARDPAVRPLMGLPVRPQDVQGVDPFRGAALEVAANDSNQFLAELGAGRIAFAEARAIVVDALGNSFRPVIGERRGEHNFARCVFEDTRMPDVAARLAGYDGAVCVSNWNAELLRAHWSGSVELVNEGIDPTIFFPGPRSGTLDPGRFHVFCGGKIEFRKGHDLVLLAFREFAARHPDAVLVGAWHSPWPQYAAGFQGRLPAALRRDAQGRLEIRRWVAENGLRADQFIEVPRIPNPMMPAVLRDMDCALQVSRCEAGTNIPAKEAMACGVPTILAANTGVRDIVDVDNCIALSDQRPVVAPGPEGTEGWGESNVDEIVAALERLYTDADLRRRIAARGPAWLTERERTWQRHADRLKAHLLEAS